jgi:Uma2 family endonuclease
MATVIPEQPPQPVPQLPPIRMHRLSVEQYHRMIETGVFTANDKVELLEGLLVSKMPHHPSHDGSTSVLARELRAILPAKWIVRIQSAVTLDDSEPEPDVAVVAGPEERYFAVHPTPGDIACLVEVAESSLEYDRTDKLRVYARNRIPVYWIVNLIENVVETYADPKPTRPWGYRQHERFGLEFGVHVVVAGKELGGIAVRKLFPR